MFYTNNQLKIIIDMTFKIVSVKVNISTYMLVVIDDNVKIQCLDYFFHNILYILTNVMSSDFGVA